MSFKRTKKRGRSKVDDLEYNSRVNNFITCLKSYSNNWGGNSVIVSIDEVNSFVSNLNLDKERQTWLNEDLHNLELCPNVLNEILPEIDFLFLDGGEFSTYKEWEKLKSRTKIVALDDIRETKTKQIYLELSEDNNYELIDSTSEGNGFCVFIKK